MTIGLLWVLLAAVALGAGSLGQAAAMRAVRATGAGSTRRAVVHPLFLAGTAAQGVGALAHVVALQTVSMAVAQTAVTGSLAVTALGARLVWGHRLGARGIAAMVALAGGLAGLAAVSSDAGTAVAGSTSALVALASTTLGLGLVAATAAGLRPARRGIALALVSGLSFATCSIGIRFLDTSSVGALVTDPFLLVLVVAGGVAALTWTLALRHAAVTTVTAVAVVAEVVPPSLLGPWLGDSVGTWFPLVAPLALAVAAAAGVVLARLEQPVPEPVPADAVPRPVTASHA